MYGTISIQYRNVTYRYKTTETDSIYDRLTALGCSHEEAENISAWAENAPIGEEYECEKPELKIEIEE